MVKTSLEESGRSKVTRGAIAILLGVVVGAFSPGLSGADYQPYPVVLVHGRDNSATSWNTIWPYLRSRGVSVTAYSITDAINECVELWGREIGDRAYCQTSPCPLGRTWMEQAQSDLGPFSKCKVATFSTGGPAIRDYLSQPYYQGDVDAVVTIDAPHMGSATRLLAKLVDAGKDDTFLEAGNALMVLGALLGLTERGLYLIASGSTYIGFHAVIQDLIIPKVGDPHTCLYDHLDFESDFIHGIHTRPYPPDVSMHFIGITGNNMTPGVPAALAVAPLLQETGFQSVDDWLFGAANVIEFFLRLEPGDGVFTLINQTARGESAFPPPLPFTASRETLNLGVSADHSLSDPQDPKAAAILRALEGPPCLIQCGASYPPPGFVLGYNVDSKTLVHEGVVTDYLPATVRVTAQTDSKTGAAVQTTVPLDLSRVETVNGGRSGQAPYALSLVLPHGGAHDITLTAVNAAGLTDSATIRTFVFANGVSFPNDGDATVGITLYTWEARVGGVKVAGGVGHLSFIGTTPGETPQETLIAPPWAQLVAVYPDGLPNPDVVFVDPTTGTPTTVVPAGESVEAHLVSRYEGRSYLNVTGNAVSAHLTRYTLEYAGAAGHIGAGAFTEAGHTILDSAEAVPGPLARKIVSWDVSTPRLTGSYALRMRLTDPALALLAGEVGVSITKGPYSTEAALSQHLARFVNLEEVDRVAFTIGTPLTPGMAAPTIVTDPYAKAEVEFEPGDLLGTAIQYANLFPSRAPPQVPLLDVGLHPIGPKFELLGSATAQADHHFSPGDFAAGQDARLTLHYTDAELGVFGIPPVIVEANLGLYREDPVTGQRTLLQTRRPPGSYTVFTTMADFDGTFLLLPSNSAPRITALAASPLAFSPENAAVGRPVTEVFLTAATGASPQVFVSVEVRTLTGVLVRRLAQNVMVALALDLVGQEGPFIAPEGADPRVATAAGSSC